eukprot:scaffold37949_cov205-Skeletonema_marinoi.AAC.6
MRKKKRKRKRKKKSFGLICSCVTHNTIISSVTLSRAGRVQARCGNNNIRYSSFNMAAEGDNIRWFNYTGEDEEVPDDATHITVDKSVRVIPEDAFCDW